MNIIAIIQARMGATRLPGKMLMNIDGKPAITHVVDRVRRADCLQGIVLATTTAPADDILYDWAISYGLPCFRGNQEDVLDRYYQTAQQEKADVVVRLTGDCPLLDPMIIDSVVEAFQTGDWDYVSNVHPPTFPDGLDVEVFSFSALETAWQSARLSSEREHVTPYIWNHPELFTASNVTCHLSDVPADLSKERWTLDTPEDLNFFRCLMPNLPSGDYSFQTVLQIINAHPEWRLLNSVHRRNEGYSRSLEKDQDVS